MDIAPTIPVPTTEAEIGTLRVPIDPDDPLLADQTLVASAGIIADFEDSYLDELTGAVEQSLRSLRQMVVQRLRAHATIAKPIAASAARNGQFMNPWHDDRGRFAPKGTGRANAIRTWGTDRKVTIEKWVSGHKHSVTTSNGDVIVLHDHNNVLSQSPGGEQAISDLLNGAADAHDLCPGMNVPQIMVKNVDGLIADMAALHDMQRVEWERLRNVGAFVTGNSPDGNKAPGWIFVNPDRLHSEQLYAQDDMPAMIALGPARYKVMHEYGHLRMTQGLDSVFAINDQFKYTSDSRRSGGMSKYGNTKPIEAHAEAFAEWAARGGNIERGPKGQFLTDIDYVVTSYANAFGWGKDLEQVGRPLAVAAAGGPQDPIPLIIGDSPEGPIYIYADGTIEETLVASAGQFMNPWHDEIGRFAPKGTGRYIKVLGEFPGEPSQEMLANADFRYQADMGKRFTWLWQRTYQTHRAVKQIARNLLAGNEPFDGVDLNDPLLERYSKPSRFAGGPKHEYNETDLHNDLQAAAEWILVQPVEKQPVLYRGAMTDESKMGVFKVGADIPLDLVSATPDRFEAAPYSSPFGSPTSYLDPVRLSFQFTGAEGTSLRPHVTGNMSDSKEVVMRGRGRITRMEKNEHGIWQIWVDASNAQEEALAASIGDDAVILAILDQPFHHYDETGALVAAAGQFMNPWHDEIGRFAPKGTGVKRLGPKTLNDDPTAYDKVDLDDMEATKASLEAYADHVTAELADMFPGEELIFGLDEYHKIAKSTRPPEYHAQFRLTNADGEDVAKMARVIEMEDDSAFAAGMWVDDSMQGKGIGTVLQEGFEHWAASQDLSAINVFATMVGRWAWMRAGYDWANTEAFGDIANLLGDADPVGRSFRRAWQDVTIPDDLPTPYELSNILGRKAILHPQFPNWSGTKPLRTRALALAATAIAPREERLAKVREAYAQWWPQYPAAAEGYIVDPEAEAAWEALMQGGLVAAGPFDLDDFNVMTAEEWALAFDVEAADIVGDVVVDAATGQALRPGLNVSDKIITDLVDRHIGRLQDLGPLVQASLRDALHLAVSNQLTLDEVIREIQATGPLGATAARAIARTELTAATNGGMLTGWKRDGFPFKQWISLHDERVRHAHLEADKQIKPTEQEFEVGGWPAQYPGDPRLPVHLRINCRCYMDRIGEDGTTIGTRLVDSTRATLYRLAQELNIPGRSKMLKEDLFQAIDRYRNGFGFQPLEEMSRAQLLIRARAAGIVGRSKMSRPELMIRLRDLSTGRTRDRWLIDAGHGTREQIAAVQTQLAADIAALHQGPIVGAGPPPSVEKVDTMRRKVFRRYGGADTGTAMCVGCAARMHWSNTTRWEQVTLIRIDPKISWSARNAFPACLACAPKLAKLGTEKLSATFTIDNSWTAIAATFTGWGPILAQFANPWHDEQGKFAPKGTGKKYDSAAIKAKVKASMEAGVNVDRVGDPQATLSKLDAWAKQMGSDFDADEGVGMIREALNDVGAGSKSLIANHKNGIAGIISYDYDPDSKMYMIHHLGSTGIAPGTGTRLATQVMIQAASNGAGVEFEAAQNDTAPEFWSSLGFDVSDPKHVVMSPSDVGAWMRDFTG